MRMKDEQIQKKLVELEATILKETRGNLTAPNKTSTELSHVSTDLPARTSSELSPVHKSDLHYFGGIGLLLLGLFMLFQHVRVSSVPFYWWGIPVGQHMGYLLFPLMLGIGWIVYNSKSVWGWLITVVSLFLLVFTIISGLSLSFYPVTMIDLLIMLLPFSIGAAFVIKGMGGAQGIDEAIKKQIAESKKK